ncbi:hypothetical protein INR49_001471 [Caranx melampygus]|nr:hypothetical protein INR49_001471 [Caranx melampygus]
MCKITECLEHQIRMFVLIWATLFFSVRRSNADAGLSQKPTVMTPPLVEGQQTTLTCTAPGLCSGPAPTFTWTWRGGGVEDSHITGNITGFKNKYQNGATWTHSSNMTFNPSAEHHGTEVTCKVSFAGNVSTEETVTLNVTYVKAIRITGDTRVKEGETLNLTCSTESFPPSHVIWTKVSDLKIQNGTGTNLWNDTLTNLRNDTLTNPLNDTFTNLLNDTLTNMWNDTYLQEGSGTATLSISNVTAGDSGLYICTAKYLNNTRKKNVDVSVIYKKELGITGNTSVQVGDVLNLTCSLDSFPPSLITWTKLSFSKNLKDEIELPSNCTGSATLTISNVTAEDSGQYVCTAKHLDMTVTVYANVTVTWFSKISKISGCEIWSDHLTCVCVSGGFPLPTIKWPLLEHYTEYSVITTVSNHTVNSTIALLVKDHSNTVEKKLKNSGNLDETLEMVTSQEAPLIYDGQAEEDDQILGQGEALDGTVAAEKTTPEPNNVPIDVDYANIDFTLLKRRSPREAVKKEESTYTEYAEIKKGKEERGDECGEKGEILEGQDEEAMIDEDKETECCVPEEEEGEDVAVYSNVKDIMGEISLMTEEVKASSVNRNFLETCSAKREVQGEGERRSQFRAETPEITGERRDRKRKKERGSRQMADSLEMVTAEAVPLMHDGQAVNDGDDGTHEPEAADGGAGAVEPKDVEYSNIDFSVLKRRSLTEAEETQDPTETEYAEIKKDPPVGGQDTAGEESEAMEGTKEEGGMTGEETNEKEPEQCVPVKDEEDVAVYSNVYEVMAESDGGDTLTENS